MESGHHLLTSFDQLGHASPVLLIALFSITIFVLRMTCKSFLKKLGHSDVKEYDKDGFEDNPNFLDSIKKIQKEHMYEDI